MMPAQGGAKVQLAQVSRPESETAVNILSLLGFSMKLNTQQIPFLKDLFYVCGYLCTTVLYR